MTSPSRPSRYLTGLPNAVVYAGLLLGALITLVPFGLGLVTSFTSKHQFVTGTPLQLPRPPTLDNYGDLAGAGFGNGRLFRQFQDLGAAEACNTDVFPRHDWTIIPWIRCDRRRNRVGMPSKSTK